MITHVVVHPPGEFDLWLDETERQSNNLPPAQRGARLFLRKGCASCHTVDGTPKIGPTLAGVYGSMVSVVGGPPLKADDDYIRRSLLSPTSGSWRASRASACRPSRGCSKSTRSTS